MKKPRTIEDLYNYCRDNNLKMLSNFVADFWEVYKDNYEYFDRLFCRTYKSFVPYGLVDSEDDEEFVVEWIHDILAFLLANQKRYSELWRMQVIPDTDYSILDNYNVRETHSTSGTSQGTDVIGGRTDTKSGSTTRGSYTDSETNLLSYGKKELSNEEETSYGQVTTTTDVELNSGQQDNNSENRVSADNESVYAPKDYNLSTIGSRKDTTETSEQVGSHRDVVTVTSEEKAYNDSESKSRIYGSRNDSDSATNIYGEHTNTHSNTETEAKTVTKKGNMGIFSNSKLLQEHQELWQAFSFYKLIFDEIAEHFLRIIYI